VSDKGYSNDYFKTVFTFPPFSTDGYISNQQQYEKLKIDFSKYLIQIN